MGRGVKRTFHNERSASFLSLKHFCDFEGAVVLLKARSRKRQSQSKTLDLTYFLKVNVGRIPNHSLRTWERSSEEILYQVCKKPTTLPEAKGV